MRLCHEPGAETQLDIIDPFAFRVLDVFAGHTAAGIGVPQHGSHPKHLRDERHHSRLTIHDVNVWPQFLNRRARQFYPMTLAEFQNCPQTHAPINVPMQIDERQLRIDIRYGHRAILITGDSADTTSLQIRYLRLMGAASTVASL